MLIETREPFPYAGLPPHQNWHSAVDALGGGGAIDPQGPVKFRLESSARIASAGSCFAQRLAVRLRDLGLCYVVAEPGGEPLSARYGDIYTSRQLVQLIERALGRFDPLERAWTSAAGFIDPFRPRNADGAFASLDALEADRCAHLAAVKHLFESVDVFLFTLGLTEYWMDARDGAVFPAVPGRGRGVFDPERHVFGNLDVAAVASDLERFIAILGEVNPAAKLILTVSPVPMAATMVPTHIVRASLHSKSVLKVAAEDVARRHAHVDYFAAYDVVMQNLGGEPLFAAGGRRPTDAVADRVVRFFVRDYFGEAIAPRALPPAAKAATANELCDEDVLLERIAADERGRIARTPLSLAPSHRNGAVEQVAHPIPLYFVGDSNSLMFRDRVFAAPDSETLYIGRTLHTPGLGAFDLCDIEGRLNEYLLTRLIGEHLLMADDKGGWTAYQRVGGAPLDFVQESEGRARPHPPVLLFCGIFDWLCFYEEIGARDVALPAEVLAADMYAADEAGMLDFDSAATIAGRYLEPLERGLRLLRSYGLRNLCLHSVQPPFPDDELFGRYFFPSTLSSRYRSVTLMNYLLRGVCERTGVAFIDLWPLVTNSDGILDLRYSFDAVHLNLEAGQLTVKVLLETIAAREADERRNAEPAQEHEAEALASMPDDIADPAELRLADGWHPVERERGNPFRWAGEDAVLYIPVFSAVDHQLSIELEPGPGVGSKAFTLEVYDSANTLLTTLVVGGRQTVHVTMHASAPVMHCVRLHAVDGGRRIGGDDRVLAYRVFRIAVVPQRRDVLPAMSGFRAGAGWYPLEQYGGSTFRWVNNDASIEVSVAASELALELEPGPGVLKQPFTLKAVDARGNELGSFLVRTRQRVVIPLPLAEPTPYVIRLRVEGGGRATLGECRTLNFRVFAADQPSRATASRRP